MSTLPRALRRARLWTTGLLTASTVLVGALGIHLADAHAQSVATQSSSSGTSSTAFRSSDSDSSDQGSTDPGFSNQGFSNQGSSSGFSPASPVGGSGLQPQTNTSGS